MKAQRIRITEPGWKTFSDVLCGVRFEDGLSVEQVAPAVIQQIGTIVRIEAADDGRQAGMGVSVQDSVSVRAEVKPELARTDATSTPAAPKAPARSYAREELEKIADEHGIAGLRDIANDLNVKGRGIVELIESIVRAQGPVASE